MFTLNRANLKSSHQTIWLIVDFLMLGLLIINLALILFDFIYSAEGFQLFLANVFPAFNEAYQPIHKNFRLYDLIFVGIFFSEFLLRWGVALKHRTYPRWYYYPFIHWYDLIGCIPVGSFRFLRILRVVSIIYRLHKYQIIDFTKSRIYQFFVFYYDAFMEELSDRIVVRVLSGVQNEIAQGSTLLDRIQDEILYPRREMLAEWISGRVASAVQQSYHPNQQQLRGYLEKRVTAAMKHNTELQRLNLLPVVGPTIRDTLENAVGDIVAQVIHEILDDLSASRNHDFIGDIVEAVLPEPQSDNSARHNQALINLLQEILDAVKAQVEIKHWRQQL